MQPIHSAQQWAKATFSNANLEGAWRNARLIDVACHIAQNSGSSFSSTCEAEDALLEGTYQFIRNDAIKPEVIPPET